MTTYDPEADAAYIPIGPTPAPGEVEAQLHDLHNPQGDGEIILDFDKPGRLIGVEVLEAKTLLRPEVLAGAVLPGSAAEGDE